MFLTKQIPHANVQGLMTVAMILLLCQACNAGTPCFVDLPVYGAKGEEISATIVAISAFEDKASKNLLEANGDRRMTVAGRRIVFSKPQSGAFKVTLRTSQGKVFKDVIALHGCEQRRSLQYGLWDSGVDGQWTTITGRIVGCSLQGDWWLRVFPMFGLSNRLPVSEGFINTKDGLFAIRDSIRGERQILTIGRGLDPIHSIGFNVFEAGSNDAGVIDLSGKCPK